MSLAKNGNFDFFVMTLQMSCGTFRQRERVTLQTSTMALKGLSKELLQYISTKQNRQEFIHVS